MLAGRVPPQREGLTVQRACNLFLSDRKARQEAGDITERTWNEYKTVSKKLTDTFGESTLVEQLQPHDFSQLRSALAKSYGPKTLGNYVNKIRMIMRYPYESGEIDKLVRWGPSFKGPPKRVLRRARKSNGQKMFSAEQIRELLELSESQPQIRAMILLGINAGYGCADCQRLTKEMIVDGWIRAPRHKTGAEREFPQWKETRKALEAVEADRAHRTAKRIARGQEPLGEEFGKYIFLTKYGNPWGRAEQDTNSPISQAFTRLLKVTDFYQAGVSFYALRHTFETIAGDTKDQIAVDRIMGHVDSTMGGEYREEIVDQRLIDVTEYVRQWLFRRRAAK